MSLETELLAQRSKATAQWRELVHETASTGTEPSLAAVTKAGGFLGLIPPAAVEKFRADVALVHERSAAILERDVIESARIAALQAVGGDESGFQRAIDAAQETLDAAKQAHGDYIAISLSRGAAAAKAARFDAARPDLFDIDE
jgi:hypothetical protein